MAQGSFTYPMVSRLDLFNKHAGIDLLELFPIEKQRDPALVDTWDYALLLEAAKKLHAAGHPVGLPISATARQDSPLWLQPLFLAFGATMVDENGNITINSDATRTVLEYLRELTQYLPADVYGWDNASNNRWIVSGNGGAICNPPSAWSVARRDKPELAEQLFHHDMPRGSKGRFRGITMSAWCIWEFAANKTAAKELLVYLASWEVAERLLEVGYDVPLLQSHAEHSVWETANPPKGTLYNYPVRGDEQLVTIGYPAPLRVSALISGLDLAANLVSRVTQAGESIADSIAWAESEIEGFMRR
jgi:ABC-type glycerol-3-phosphate transport system substrate-binding protein